MWVNPDLSIGVPPDNTVGCATYAFSRAAIDRVSFIKPTATAYTNVDEIRGGTSINSIIYPTIQSLPQTLDFTPVVSNTPSLVYAAAYSAGEHTKLLGAQAFPAILTPEQNGSLPAPIPSLDGYCLVKYYIWDNSLFPYSKPYLIYYME
jgi:hypothetical protein